jgi:hypothetical protein
MQQIVELKIEETKIVVGGFARPAAPAVPVARRLRLDAGPASMRQW